MCVYIYIYIYIFFFFFYNYWYAIFEYWLECHFHLDSQLTQFLLCCEKDKVYICLECGCMDCSQVELYGIKTQFKFPTWLLKPIWLWSHWWMQNRAVTHSNKDINLCRIIFFYYPIYISKILCSAAIIILKL